MYHPLWHWGMWGMSQSQGLQVASAATCTSCGQKDPLSLVVSHRLRRNPLLDLRKVPPGSCGWAKHWNKSVTWGFKFALHVLVCNQEKKKVLKSAQCRMQSWASRTAPEAGPLNRTHILQYISSIWPCKYDQELFEREEIFWRKKICFSYGCRHQWLPSDCWNFKHTRKSECFKNHMLIPNTNFL